MDLSYREKKLNNRLDGLQKEKAIYEYVLENVGEKVIKTKLMRRFGYYMQGSSTDNFIRTRLLKYVKAVPYLRVKRRGRLPYVRYQRTIRDIIWLPSQVVDNFRLATISRKRWGHHLCFKKTVPFWLLKEYGGPYTGREFITEVNKRIKETKNEIASM